jgi:membrane protease YdiL (CAAX protease family)
MRMALGAVPTAGYRKSAVEIPALTSKLDRNTGLFQGLKGFRLVEKPLRRTRPLWYWTATAGAVAFACFYSLALFTAVPPTLTSQARQIFNFTGGESISLVYTLLAVLAVAYAEELIFRLGIQNLLASALSSRAQGYGIAMVLTALLCTIGHAGTLDPEWVKLAQIFPIGLVFGGLFRYYGIEAAVIAHGGFNVIMAVAAESMIIA